PEPQLVLFAVAQLARRLGVPFRSGGNLTASKVSDAQAAYESAVSFLPALQAGVNFLLHSAGWLEGGLTMGYEKFVLDADQAAMAERMVGGVDISANGLALDAILTTGPGEHYLGSDHTMANFETGFWRSELADHSSFEQWTDDGSRDSVSRAYERWSTMLATYEPPPIDAAVDEELSDWVQRRKRTLSDPEV
ncbi:MAG: trimethylamine methyltransferase family protein, partial [Acidimicrobiia bacterium]